jgi:two-component system sensor histidine kinase CpxA
MGGLILERGPWVKLGLGAIAFSVLFWLPLLSGITRSIGKITHATQRIAEGQFDVRVSSRRRDELGALAEAINQMAGRLDGMVKGQKRFLGDVAHELCSPLARLQMALGIIEQHASGNQVTYAKSASEKAEQIAKLVNALLAFSKASFGAQAVNFQPVNVEEAVKNAIKGEAVDGVKIQLAIPGELTVSADPELLVRALANLIRNAIRHNSDGGTIDIGATKNGNMISITIADSGPGVPDVELAKIFDAFYRVDTARTRETGGVGLGLAIVKTCIESCKGSVTARNRDPGGLEVLIRLPAADGSPGLTSPVVTD